MVGCLYDTPLVRHIVTLERHTPQKIVLSSGKTTLSAAQLLEGSRSIAAGLLELGFREGDTVAMAVPPGKEFMEVFYALLMLRGRIALIDPEMGRDNYAAKMRQLSPVWIFADYRLLFLAEHRLLKRVLQKFVRKIPDIAFTGAVKMVATGKKLPLRGRHVALDSIRSSATGKTLPPLTVSDESADNIIVYTSGTLDVPKGVVHSDQSLCATIRLLKKVMNAGENDVVGAALPHFVLLGIAAGLTVKTVPPRLSPAKMLRWIEDEGINILFCPPSELLPLVNHCESSGRWFPRALKHLMLGSAPVHRSFLFRLLMVVDEQTRITCTYGMTEHLLVAVEDGRVKARYDGEGDLLGKVIEGVEVRIGEDHEIFVRSPQMFSRYFHLPANSEWHATGDLGRIDSDGNLLLLGRKKEMIIRRDFNIYPALYEGTIKNIPGVDEAVLVGVYDDALHDERVYLAIEGKDADTGRVEKLLRHGAFSIDRQALPDVVFSMRIPRKGRQDKVDRSAIVQYITEEQL
jgi:acyl-CoA synthetase (AMP-forming)/AMP-acid ligase II